MMKKFALLLAAAFCLAATTQGAVVLIEDFSSYDLGSINGQGGWEAQKNSSSVGDSNHANVVAVGEHKVLQATNRDADGELDTVYITYDMGANALTGGTTTLYFKFKADGPNDTLFCTNDLVSGFDSDGDGTPGNGVPQDQALTDYSNQGAMVVLRTDHASGFRARDGSGSHPAASGKNNYADQPNTVLASNTWYEMWMWIDNVAGTTIYNVAELGGMPMAVINPTDGSTVWYHRNQGHANAAVENLKMMVGNQPVETNVLIADIGVDTQTFSCNSVGNVPEPASLTLIALGGLLAIRRR